VKFRAVHEAKPGPVWAGLFREFWPGYREWSFGESAGRRPARIVAEERLRQQMPELRPTYRRLLELAGGDNEAARFLCLYRPAPYVMACSQAVWTGDEPVLVRNYDYDPRLWEGVLLCSEWTGRRVLAMSDCLWGVLDGMNDAGLAVSLAFGGRKVVGDGFGSPLILRYVLEFCETAKQAAEVLTRIPTHMAYNITVLDAHGEFFTAFLCPDRPPVLRRWPLATNHQDDEGGWPQYVAATSSLERERFLARRLGDPRETLDGLIGRFGAKPLHNTRYDVALGTLYTAVYYPWRRRMELRWPDRTIVRTLDGFEDETFDLTLRGTTGD
jgi:predicted choloylglycine hydrolase